MQSYTVTQKLISLSATYLVKEGQSDDIIMTIKGKLLSFTPKLEANQGSDGPLVATLVGNFLKTKFDILANGENLIGSVTFPFFSFLKSYTLHLGEVSYKSKGTLISNTFSCTDENGKEILTVSKDFAFRDKFTISADDSVPKEVAILSAVAIDQRFFQEKS